MKKLDVEVSRAMAMMKKLDGVIDNSVGSKKPFSNAFTFNLSGTPPGLQQLRGYRVIFENSGFKVDWRAD
jgi:hypothetical protein